MFYVPSLTPKCDSFRLEIPLDKITILPKGQLCKELQTIEVETGLEVDAPFIRSF